MERWACDVIKSIFRKVLEDNSSNGDNDNGYTSKSISLSLYNMRNFSNTNDEINNFLEMFALEVEKCSGL